MFKINLVPEVQERKLKIKRINTISTVFSAALIVAVVAGIIILTTISTVQKVSINSTEKKTAEVKSELEGYKELEEIVLSLEKGLAGVKLAMDGGNSWQELLSHLERSIPGDVKFTSLKVKSNSIEGELEGSSVESLAKFVDSLKGYQVVTISGIAGTDEPMIIRLDGTELIPKIKSNGQWKKALVFDPAAAHEIVIITGDEEKKLSFDPVTKKITAEDDDTKINAEVKNLFTSVDTTRYEKEGSVKFDAKITFEGSALW